MQPSLVIMAAGLGSRFGGVKQLAPVGPKGEAILDFSIRDARHFGFGPVVLIVREEIEDDVRRHITAHHLSHDGLAVHYVRQDDLGPPRAKPWGTLHAILSARAHIDRPFAVINADDYYGARSFELACHQLMEIEPGLAGNVAFELGNTVPPRGAVTRALCEVDDGHLTAIVETDGCERLESGALVAGGREVSADTPVSMNLWCFHQSAIGEFEERWHSFFDMHGDDEKAECQLPTAVGELMALDRLRVRVDSSPEQWIGITNPDDLDLARAALAESRST